MGWCCVTDEIHTKTGIPVRELLKLLAFHGDEFRFKLPAPFSLDASKKGRNGPSSGDAMLRRSRDRFYPGLSISSYQEKRDTHCTWVVLLSPRGTTTLTEIEYEFAGPTDAEMRELYEREQHEKAAKTTALTNADLGRDTRI